VLCDNFVNFAVKIDLFNNPKGCVSKKYMEKNFQNNIPLSLLFIKIKVGLKSDIKQ
jgi:hypothetical protein